MKKTNEIISECVGLTLDAKPTTPMDKKECEFCMEKYIEEYKTEIIKDVILTMEHARFFISSREKMHPSGIELYDELLEKLELELEGIISKAHSEQDVENGYCERCLYDEEAERCHECDEDFSEFKEK